jgi:peptidyl-prolyl cis-trans isomerase C
VGGAGVKRTSVLGVALALLALSAVSLAAPAKKTTASKPAVGKTAANDSDAVLVRIGKDAITRRTLNARLLDIPEQYRANYTTPEGRQQLLDRMIEERVWLMDAESHGVGHRPDVERQLASQRRDLVIRTWVNELMAENPAPSDSEAKAYYDSHEADFKVQASVTVRHIQLKTEADAKRVLALAKAKGADWNKLVTQYSADSTTRTNGGSLGSVTKDGNFAALGAQPALAESALKLTDGAIAGPYKTNKGWHVLKIDSAKPESMRPFETVHTFITRTLTQQRQGTFYQDRLKQARERIGVAPDSSVIKNFLSAKKTARELFQDAQQAGSADSRIAGYRKVVESYPDADIAPQAQFMIGFIQSEELKNFDDAEKSFRKLLATYPHSELAASAQWMVDHMRSEDAPNFPGADSVAAQAAGKATKK